MKSINKILNRKHLLITGGSEKERRGFVSEIIKKANFETFRFPPKMKLFDEYYDFIKSKKLYKPWYKQKSYIGDQILDFHWDWISENNVLVVMEEFDYMEEGCRIALLKDYLNVVENRKKGDSVIHLIISQENEGGIIDKLSEGMYVRDNERRTKRQIVEQNIELIDIKNM